MIPWWSGDHTNVPGKCRHASLDPVATLAALGIERSDAHPRTPSEPDRQAQDTAASSEDPPDAAQPATEPAPAAEASGSSDAPAPASASDSRPSDWTKFNIGASLQVLRKGSPAACLRELRKLHLRWWHANVNQMTNMLSAAGLPQSILDACKHVVKTCRECRAWETPGRALQQSLTLSTHFNENVETDCVFIHQYIIEHFVDRCCRGHAGGIIPSRNKEDMSTGLFCNWIGIHGPMENLITDGETALNTHTAKNRLLQEGINLRTRARASTRGTLNDTVRCYER